MLGAWDFGDQDANSATPLVNRQKSARNLLVVSVDRPNRTATFHDPKRNVTNSATLSGCDCNDFNFAGKNPRKTFAPCMHVYRLAIELGLLAAKYQDRGMRQAAVVEKKRRETDRLQSLPSDQGQWGGWDVSVHDSGLQKNRQLRAY